MCNTNETLKQIASNNRITCNVYGLHLENDNDKSFSVNFSGKINTETLSTYLQKIKLFSTFNGVDFSLSGYGSKEFGIGRIDLIQAKWDYYKDLLEKASDLDKLSHATENIKVTITKLVVGEKEYYCISNQEPSEKLYKKSRIYSVKDNLKLLKPNEFFTMTSDIDCIIDEHDECFYSFKNTNVIGLFDLDRVIAKYVSDKIEELDAWQFVSNIEDIKRSIEQKNVYSSLYQILSKDSYANQLKTMSAEVMKERIIRVSNGDMTEENFTDSKLIITKSNRAYILKLLAKKMKYNIAFDSVEN